MIENKNKMLEHSLVYGLIIGLVIVLYQIVLYIFGMLNNNALGNVIFFLLVIGIFFSVKHYRDHVNGGFLNFGKAFQTGFLTCVFLGVIGAVYNYFQYKYLSPHLINDLLTMAQESLLNKGYPEGQVELQSTILEKYMTPLVLSIAYFFRLGFWGAVLSLVIAAIIKRDENPLQSRNPGSDI
jgi:hypothetical protein